MEFFVILVCIVCFVRFFDFSEEFGREHEEKYLPPLDSENVFDKDID